MPAQPEEVIVDPDLVQAEHLGERLAQGLLELYRPARGLGQGRARGVRGGQRGPVELPAGGQRQLLASTTTAEGTM